MKRCRWLHALLLLLTFGTTTLVGAAHYASFQADFETPRLAITVSISAVPYAIAGIPYGEAGPENQAFLRVDPQSQSAFVKALLAGNAKSWDQGYAETTH